MNQNGSTDFFQTATTMAKSWKLEARGRYVKDQLVQSAHVVIIKSLGVQADPCVSVLIVDTMP